jgi:hypothetical protein
VNPTSVFLLPRQEREALYASSSKRKASVKSPSPRKVAKPSITPSKSVTPGYKGKGPIASSRPETESPRAPIRKPKGSIAPSSKGKASSAPFESA